MSDVWHYSLNNRAWRFVKGPTTPDTTATGGPAPRFFSHGWLSPDTSELIIFGGSMMADTWKFNYLTRRWYNRPYAFTPSPRLGGCTFRDGNTLYLFGGQGPYPNDYNDLWAYNGEKSGWTMILRAASEFPANPPQTNVFYNASRPSVRARVNCHQVPGSRLVYMYSGATWEGTYFSDVWVFSLDLLQWARVNAFATTSTYSPLGVGASTRASPPSFFFFFFFFFFFERPSHHKSFSRSDTCILIRWHGVSKPSSCPFWKWQILCQDELLVHVGRGLPRRILLLVYSRILYRLYCWNESGTQSKSKLHALSFGSNLASAWLQRMHTVSLRIHGS
jgi:hypothetical protein